MNSDNRNNRWDNNMRRNHNEKEGSRGGRRGRGGENRNQRRDRSERNNNNHNIETENNKNKNNRFKRINTLLTPSETAVLRLKVQDDGTTFKVVLKDTAVVEIKKATGELVLQSGGWRTISTLGAINTALRPIRMQVVEVEGDSLTTGNNWELRSFSTYSNGNSVPSANGFGWSSVSDIQAFSDGMIVDTLTKLSDAQSKGLWTIVEQHLKQTQHSLRTRLRYGKRPPPEVTLNDKFFVQSI